MQENFYRGWTDYRQGFGRLQGEMWLGLEALHQLTNSGNYELRVDMVDYELGPKYAHYKVSTVWVSVLVTIRSVLAGIHTRYQGHCQLKPSYGPHQVSARWGPYLIPWSVPVRSHCVEVLCWLTCLCCIS